MGNERRELHLKRLRQALERVPEFREGTLNAHSPEFQRWQDRVQQSLAVVFNEGHDYHMQFLHLQFCLPRVSLGYGPSWTREDQKAFEEDLAKAQGILEDALEEAEAVGDQPRVQRERTSQEGQDAPSVVVQVTNVLHQTTQVSLSQVLAELRTLSLTAEQEKEAEEIARNLSEEIEGKRRWPVIGDLVDKAKNIGQPVFEKVALPLLLELLKRESGLS